MSCNEINHLCKDCNGCYVPHEGVSCIKYCFYQCKNCNKLAFECSTCHRFVVYNSIRCYSNHIQRKIHKENISTSSKSDELLNNDYSSEDIRFSNSDLYN